DQPFQHAFVALAALKNVRAGDLEVLAIAHIEAVELRPVEVVAPRSQGSAAANADLQEDDGLIPDGAEVLFIDPRVAVDLGRLVRAVSDGQSIQGHFGGAHRVSSITRHSSRTARS